MTEVIHS